VEATGNHWLILQSVSLARLQELSQEPTFMAELVKLQAPRERYMCRESCSQVRMRVLKKGRHFGWISAPQRGAANIRRRTWVLACD